MFVYGVGDGRSRGVVTSGIKVWVGVFPLLDTEHGLGSAQAKVVGF